MLLLCLTIIFPFLDILVLCAWSGAHGRFGPHENTIALIGPFEGDEDIPKISSSPSNKTRIFYLNIILPLTAKEEAV